LVILVVHVASCQSNSEATKTNPNISDSTNNNPNNSDSTNNNDNKVTTNSKPYFIAINSISINLGSPFTLSANFLKISAYDSEDGDVTKNILISGIVNTFKEGSYPLIITVKDSKGLTATMNYTVHVVSLTKEVILTTNNFNQYFSINIVRKDSSKSVIYKITLTKFNNVNVVGSLKIDINLTDSIKIRKNFGAATGPGTENVSINLSLNFTNTSLVTSYTYTIQDGVKDPNDFSNFNTVRTTLRTINGKVLVLK
jgi:hypothetical protein